MMFSCFFFFKQKTAYEMRISDWSSDVCSSDLVAHQRRFEVAALGQRFAVSIEASAKRAHHLADVLADDEITDAELADLAVHVEIGRASCRERVCQYV